MKTVILSPQSVKPSTPTITTTTMEDNQSSYFPGCRKDANCNCEICLASINATLDLMPMSVQKSSLTKLSFPKQRALQKTPVSIDPTLLSTPVSRTPDPIRVSTPTPTPLKSTAKTVSVCPRISVAKKWKLRFGLRFFRWVLLFVLVLGFEVGFSKGVLRVLRPRLTGEIVRGVAEKVSVVKNVSERLMLFQQGLMGYVDGQVSSCNLGDSGWKINQDGLLLKSNCVLFRWAGEEVIIAGWPLQTAGILTAGFSSRSFTVLSGKVTEWPEGSIVSVVREINSTWVQRKWSASVVKFDPNTWIIEYKQSMFLENASIFFPAVEFFKFSISKFTNRIKQQLWLLSDQRHPFIGFIVKSWFEHPNLNEFCVSLYLACVSVSLVSTFLIPYENFTF